MRREEGGRLTKRRAWCGEQKKVDREREFLDGSAESVAISFGRDLKRVSRRSEKEENDVTSKNMAPHSLAKALPSSSVTCR